LSHWSRAEQTDSRKQPVLGERVFHWLSSRGGRKLDHSNNFSTFQPLKNIIESVLRACASPESMVLILIQLTCTAIILKKVQEYCMFVMYVSLGFSKGDQHAFTIALR
jgi:hypothetical protein